MGTMVAIIGCGWAGTRHAQAFRASGAGVRWCVDADPARARALAALGGAGGAPALESSDYRHALDDPAVQAVDICLPHYLHAEVATAAAQAGKHVLCEKPLAHALDAADAMIDAAQRAGVVLMVAENELFHPLYQQVRALLDGGAIGRPALVQLTRECYLNRSFLEERRWFLDAHMAAGGMMMSGGVHTFATLRSLLGEIASIQALRAPQRFLDMEGDDTSIAMVRFASGVVGTVVESFCMKSLRTAAGEEVHWMRIDGDLGHLAAIAPHTIRLFSEHPHYACRGLLAEQEIHVPAADTFQREVEHFLACIRSGEEPLTSGPSQRRPLEVVLAAYRSMKTGLPEHLPIPAG